MKLFCFPHAGSGSRHYLAWQKFAGERLEVCPVAYPGRERRMREPFLESLPQLVDDLLPGLLKQIDAPFAMYGHSMGGVVAFEIARRLQAEGLIASLLAVGASAAPPLRSPPRGMSQLPREEFVLAIGQRYGGLPAEVLNHPELLDLLVPVLRADMALMERYQYEPGLPLECPILCLGGASDESVSQPQLAGWADMTHSRARVEVLAGGHFFIQKSAPAIVRQILDMLDA